jgi:hypothetical protein
MFHPTLKCLSVMLVYITKESGLEGHSLQRGNNWFQVHYNFLGDFAVGTHVSSLSSLPIYPMRRLLCQAAGALLALAFHDSREAMMCTTSTVLELHVAGPHFQSFSFRHIESMFVIPCPNSLPSDGLECSVYFDF